MSIKFYHLIPGEIYTVPKNLVKIVELFVRGFIFLYIFWAHSGGVDCSTQNFFFIGAAYRLCGAKNLKI